MNNPGTNYLLCNTNVNNIHVLTTFYSIDDKEQMLVLTSSGGYVWAKLSDLAPFIFPTPPWPCICGDDHSAHSPKTLTVPIHGNLPASVVGDGEREVLACTICGDCDNFEEELPGRDRGETCLELEAQLRDDKQEKL